MGSYVSLKSDVYELTIMFQGERVRPPYYRAMRKMAWHGKTQVILDLIEKQGTKLEVAGLGPATGAVELAGAEPDRY